LFNGVGVKERVLVMGGKSVVLVPGEWKDAAWVARDGSSFQAMFDENLVCVIVKRAPALVKTSKSPSPQ
jgi:hypothetical protein